MKIKKSILTLPKLLRHNTMIKLDSNDGTHDKSNEQLNKSLGIIDKMENMDNKTQDAIDDLILVKISNFDNPFYNFRALFYIFKEGIVQKNY